MRFALIDRAKAEFPVHRLCRVLGVSQSGYFAWRGRSACRRQRDDMVLLAHVRSAFALSNGTYGSPRMRRELQDIGLVVGRRALQPLRRFAKHLSADYDAVRAAVTQGWSNGPVEGQINRLKMLKRTMYGRAGLDLLGHRFLLAA